MSAAQFQNDQRVTAFYEADHDRLDGLFKQYQERRTTDLLSASRLYQEFRIGLQRHIVWEEKILFPLFEEKTGLAERGPTHVMRMEHRLIKNYLHAIYQKIEAGDSNTELEEQMLLNTLFAHNQKEELILYPEIDRLLDGQERSRVFSSMENMPPELYMPADESDQ